jgi:DNA repair and recombination protein RAD52
VLSDALALEEDFGDFDMADFGVTEDGHPDEVVLPGSHSSDKPQNAVSGSVNRPPINGHPSRPMQPPSRPAAQPPRPPHTPNQQPQRPGAPFQGRSNAQHQPPKPPSHANTAAQQAAANNKMMTPPPNVSSRPINAMNAANGASNEPATFFSARSVKDVPEHADPGTAVLGGAAKVFDPRAESPSIRKTPGIDHKSSKPLSKTGVHVQPLQRDPDQQRPAPSGPPNVVNPSLTQMRQIGAPGGAGSPLGNRGQYRPPTMKRPAPNGPDGGNRPPLTEVSTNGPPPPAGAGAMGVDAKRQKMA